MSHQYRIAIIGTGNAVNSHLQAVRSVQDRADLVAAVDIEDSRVRTFAETNGIPRWFASTTAMLEAVHPDLVCIVTPPATHVPLTLACLEAGAHVYCEKPLCASLAEFDRIAEAETRTSRTVSTVFQWRFGSAVAHLREMMADGLLGKPLVGTCQTLWYRPQLYYDVPWRGKWATETGGPTMTLGIHLMDLFLYLMGDWTEISAMIGTLDRAIEVEDVSLAMVRFANGMLGTITNSALSPRQHTHLRLDFQRATVEVNALYRYRNEDWTLTLPDNATDTAPLTRWNALTLDTTGGHNEQVRALLDSLDRGESPLVSRSEARRIIEFTTSLYKSAFTRQIVQRGTITPGDPFYQAMNGQPGSGNP